MGNETIKCVVNNSLACGRACQAKLIDAKGKRSAQGEDFYPRSLTCHLIVMGRESKKNKLSPIIIEKGSWLCEQHV